MWAIKVLTVGDAYREFQIILYYWMRYIGLIVGQDIFMEDFRIHSQTVLVLMFNCSLPFLFWLTQYRFDNELGMIAGTFVITGFKVCMPWLIKI